MISCICGPVATFFHLLATASKEMVVSESETDVMGLVLSVSTKLILVIKLMMYIASYSISTIILIILCPV